MAGGPATKTAAASYFKLVSSLSAKALSKQALTEQEKQSVFRALDCYSLSAQSEGVLNRAGLDAEFMKNQRAFDGMYALMGALNGTFSEMSIDKDEACSSTN